MDVRHQQTSRERDINLLQFESHQLETMVDYCCVEYTYASSSPADQHQPEMPRTDLILNCAATEDQMAVVVKHLSTKATKYSDQILLGIYMKRPQMFGRVAMSINVLIDRIVSSDSLNIAANGITNVTHPLFELSACLKLGFLGATYCTSCSLMRLPIAY